MKRVSDWIVEFLEAQGVEHVFLLSGGGAMFMIDALGRSERIELVCNHHEQAVAFAAEAYQRVAGKPGVALVTTGPAGTNAITGVLCAWTDSIPMVVISGQAKSTTLLGDKRLRQSGVHEANITAMVATVTKMAVTLMDAREVSRTFQEAFHVAQSGRPGPVWIDVPLDIQNAPFDSATQLPWEPPAPPGEPLPRASSDDVEAVLQRLAAAERPVILAGHGVKLAGQEDTFRALLEVLGVPAVTTKNAFDLLPHDHPAYAGQVGTYGQRVGNFTMQNADVLLVLGSRLCAPVTGYEADLFAREADVIVVDVDEEELAHLKIKTSQRLVAHLGSFLPALVERARSRAWPDRAAWWSHIRRWRDLFHDITPAQRERTDYVDPYHFFEVLSEEMEARDILVWDQGATFYASTVGFKLKAGQRAFSNGGFTPMGYGLPAAIGASFAAAGQRRVVCVHGDGGLALNVQELQTVYHHQLPLVLFVFDNQGYLSIKNTQRAYFEGRFVGSDPGSGLSCPDTLKLAAGYQLEAFRIAHHGELREGIRRALDHGGPIVVEVVTDPLQEFTPRVTTRVLPDGTLRSNPLEDMSPLLDREVFTREMIVKPAG